MGYVPPCLNCPYPVPCQAESLVPGNVGVVDGVVVAVAVSCMGCCSSSTFVVLHTRDAPLETGEAYLKFKQINIQNIVITLKKL